MRSRAAPDLPGPATLNADVAGRIRNLFAEAEAHSVSASVDALLRLYTLGDAIQESSATAEIGALGVTALRDAGLLRSDDSTGLLRATARLSPIEDLVVASDLTERHAARAADFVLGPFGTTRRLASFILPGQHEAVLDLGCGCGAIGLIAAGSAERVVCSDLNPRAVAFARFNAELNGRPNVECRVGNLYEPVEGERFDLILCNPPYVLSPDQTYQYRDGGYGLSRQIVEEAPAHLQEGGSLVVCIEWPERVGEDWRAEVADWLRDVPCDAWLLRQYSFAPPEYARMWLRQEWGNEEPPVEVVERWVRFLSESGIESVGGGVLVLRQRRSRTQIRTLRVAPRAADGEPLGPSLVRWMDAQTLLHTRGPEALLDVPLRPAPGLRRIERRVPTGDGWARESSELRLTQGLRFGAALDPVAEEIVGLLDGSRTSREAIAHFAGSYGLPAEAFLRGWPSALEKLMGLGLLVAPEGSPH